MPDGDLFRALRSGRASIVTDTIATFTETGVALASGETIDADVAVAATGLELQPLGGIRLSVDGADDRAGRDDRLQGRDVERRAQSRLRFRLRHRRLDAEGRPRQPLRLPADQSAEAARLSPMRAARRRSVDGEAAAGRLFVRRLSSRRRETAEAGGGRAVGEPAELLARFSRRCASRRSAAARCGSPIRSGDDGATQSGRRRRASEAERGEIARQGVRPGELFAGAPARRLSHPGAQSVVGEERRQGLPAPPPRRRRGERSRSCRRGPRPRRRLRRRRGSARRARPPRRRRCRSPRPTRRPV